MILTLVSPITSLVLAGLCEQLLGQGIDAGAITASIPITYYLKFCCTLAQAFGTGNHTAAACAHTAGLMAMSALSCCRLNSVS